MPIHNSEIVDIFNEVADLLEIENANPFRVQAYRNAARTVGGSSHRIADWVANGQDLSELPGVGKDLAGKIAEICKTGKLPLLEEVRSRVPQAIREFLKIPGLGPKRIHILYDELKIKSLDELKNAAETGKLQAVYGFGTKIAEKIATEIDRLKGHKPRVKLIIADEFAHSLIHWLTSLKGIKQFAVAGSYRRQMETVGDLDIVITCNRSAKIMEHFTADLDFTRFGVGQARRGWLEATDILNTRSWKELQKLLR